MSIQRQSLKDMYRAFIKTKCAPPIVDYTVFFYNILQKNVPETTQKNAVKHLNQKAQGLKKLLPNELSLQACAQRLRDTCHLPSGQVPASRSIRSLPSCKIPGSSVGKGSIDAKGSRHSLALVDEAYALPSAKWTGDS